MEEDKKEYVVQKESGKESEKEVAKEEVKFRMMFLLYLKLLRMLRKRKKWGRLRWGYQAWKCLTTMCSMPP